MVNKNKRSKYLIYPAFQLKIIVLFITLALITITIYYGSIAYIMHKFILEGQRIGLKDNHIYFKFIEQQKNFINIIFLSVSISFIGLVTALGVFLSHKIAGPLYRLSQDLRSFTRGTPLREIQFRKGDFFTELADDFNSFVKMLISGK